MRLVAEPFARRVGTIVMTVAVLAFALQATFIAPSESATGETAPYHHGYARSHAHHAAASAHSHEASHVHADGTVHRHLIDDDDGALDEHIQEPGCPCCWNVAIIVGVLPALNSCTVFATLGDTFILPPPVAFRGTEPDGPRRPPRPPSIA